MKQTTLCYIENEDSYLMLYRNKKQNDVNRDKWVGVGGKFLDGESPEECLLREVREETGLTLLSWRYRGIVTFVSDRWEGEHMHLFTSSEYEGSPGETDEGELKWVKKSEVCSLPIWEGDKIFLKLLKDEAPFFSLKLSYEGDVLKRAALNGKEYKPPLLISSCLLGNPCRYDGRAKLCERASALGEKYRLIPVCPESCGGLKIPRPASEISGGRVKSADGSDVSREFQKGAETAVRLAKMFGCDKAVLKAKSPSCGRGRVYDGSFSGRLVPGDGVAAAALKREGIEIFTENDLDEL